MTEILGYPALFFIKEARRPAVKAPINAAAAGGKFIRSTSSRRSVFAIAPINAAVTASGTGLLNIMEKPKTPQKLARSRNKIQPDNGNEIFRKSTGWRWRIKAIIQADIVATKIMIRA